MAEKMLNVRLQLKTDTESAWTQVENSFTPLSGELLVIRTTEGGIRFKIGDGTSTFAQLPYTDENLITTISALQQAVTTLTSTVSGHTSSINTLQIDLDSAEGNITTLQGDVSGLESTVGTLAPKASPAFTGTPTAPTATAGTSNTQIATTAFVANAVASAGGGGTEVIVSPTQPSSQDVGGLWFKTL